MTKAPTATAVTPMSATRIADIAAKISQTCAGVGSDMSDLDDARAIVTKVAEAGVSKREAIMGQIADLSLADNWTTDEIKSASKIAIEAHNNLTTAKAMANFITEIKKAAHPHVRDHFKALVSIRDTAWQAETDQLEMAKGTNIKVPTPLRKWAKRSYHLLTFSLKACEDGVLFQTCEDIVDYATAHDPDHNAKKVMERLKAIHATLAAFYVDFPDDDVGFAVDTLGKVTAEALTKARNSKIAENAAPVMPVVSAPVVSAPATIPTVVKNTRPAPVVATTTTVIDDQAIIDDLLGDNLALAEAA